MKKALLSLFAVAIVLLCLLALPQTAHAASADDLYFCLNETGDGYIMSDCNSAASGELVIPATYNGLPVTTIGELAFSNCTSLTSITIPDSVTTIGEGAFYGCSSLTSIIAEEGNPVYHSAGNCIIETATKTLIAGCQTSQIPANGSVTTIGWGAFSHCTNLTSATIPNSVTSIGDYAFDGCDGLTSVTIPDSVTSIGNWVFNYCPNLMSIIVEEGNPVYHSAGNCIIETETRTLIFGCQTSQIPTYGSVTSIGDRAFASCTSLTSITIPDSVTSIGEGAFTACDSLTSITLPNSVTTIGDLAFAGCSCLTGMQVEEGNPVYHSAGNCIIKTETKTLVTGCQTSQIPADGSVTAIGNWAFSDCSSLTSITIPDSITTIGYAAFSYCSSLTNVTIPDSVTTIGEGAFYGCDSLTSVTIPDSVTTIGDRAFNGCYRLTSVTYCGTQEQWDAIEIGSNNRSLLNAALQFHDMEDGVCSICGFGKIVIGDMDGDEQVTYQDAIYLLLNSIFGEESYPLNGAEGDMDGDGTVNSDDAIYLLLHVMFGETFYPLKKG